MVPFKVSFEKKKFSSNSARENVCRINSVTKYKRKRKKKNVKYKLVCCTKERPAQHGNAP